MLINAGIFVCFDVDEFGDNLCWLADEAGEILSVGDFYFYFDFDLSAVRNYIKYKYTFGQISAHYYASLEARKKNQKVVCIRDWIKLNGGKNGK